MDWTKRVPIASSFSNEELEAAFLIGYFELLSENADLKRELKEKPKEARNQTPCNFHKHQRRRCPEDCKNPKPRKRGRPLSFEFKKLESFIAISDSE